MLATTVVFKKYKILKKKVMNWIVAVETIQMSKKYKRKKTIHANMVDQK